VALTVVSHPVAVELDEHTFTELDGPLDALLVDVNGDTLRS
jgi:hypothetical protein